METRDKMANRKMHEVGHGEVQAFPLGDAGQEPASTAHFVNLKSYSPLDHLVKKMAKQGAPESNIKKTMRHYSSQPLLMRIDDISKRRIPNQPSTRRVIKGFNPDYIIKGQSLVSSEI